MKALRNVCGLPKNDSDRSSLRWQKENQQLRGADELVEAAQKSENQDEAVLGRRRGNTREATARRRIIVTEVKTLDIFRER
jgi:hypothetical protein